ncbi:MAG: response regulator [Elusimicrobia bacterium]|nr:response regulator [Elusimicrobiota bacterium]
MKRILAVDDDQSMTDLYRALLTDAGYEVLTAPEAVAASQALASFKPDLVILDAEMPGGGGEKVFESGGGLLKSGLPLIFVTGLPERVEKLALKFPNVGVMAKPVKAEELLSVIAELIGPGA